MKGYYLIGLFVVFGGFFMAITGQLTACPPTPTCTLNEVGILKPYPLNCSRFIYCDEGGKAVISVCPPSYEFSPNASACKPTATANCPVCYPACPPPPACTLADMGVLKPYPKNCTNFIYCDQYGNSKLSICRAGLEFNAVTGYCTDPATANCTKCA